MNMHAAPPTMSRIFADRYRREATRLERLHANHLAPGTTTWGDAMEAMEGRMSKLGGPVKRTAAIRKASEYLRETQKDGMHFILGTYFTKRSSVLSFATINYGPHPLAGVNEDGVSIMRHSVACRRDGSGWTSTNRSLGYISRHAIQRLHQRKDGLTQDTATQIFTCVGMLGHMIADSDSERHIEGTMSLHVDEMIATGMIRYAVSEKTACVFFEVRTFLQLAELELSEARGPMIRQGDAAFNALHKWYKSDRDRSQLTALVEAIPFIPGRGEDDFVYQTAVKTEA